MTGDARDSNWIPKYGDRVSIREGFYRGMSGLLIGMNSRGYLVSLDDFCGIGEVRVNFDIHDLELRLP